VQTNIVHVFLIAFLAGIGASFKMWGLAIFASTFLVGMSLHGIERAVRSRK